MKKDFPIFNQRPDLIYFDNAATAQKPQAVLDAIQNYYDYSNSNIHRGPNFLAEEATVLYNDARRTVADFIGAREPYEVIFTRNATESINLVARSLESMFNPGDTIVLSQLEHHSNIVPWLQLKERRGIQLKYIPVNKEGRLDFDESILDDSVKLVAVTGMSNALGTITDLKPIIEAAHMVGAKILVDASQLVVHEPVNVQNLDCDFLVFTGHKLYGPTGIGVLYGKKELLESMPPFLGGGDMINEVTEQSFSPAGLPEKFEAGTPNIAGAIGLKAAIDFMLTVGLKSIHKKESELTHYALNQLKALDFVKLIGPQDTKNRGSIFSFTIDDIHPHDIAEGLSNQNICIRGGHHCAQVLMDQFVLSGTARMSLAFYNEKEEVDVLLKTLVEIYDYFN